ncbi:MAG: hypothetical protein P4L35_03370 [Ignavibacteriaceae bacterium]|nr:hypothetical protein [Ignavibacteriaceae bacterium]
MYPREISNIEKTCLSLILPENKLGYNLYRNKIAAMKIIGDGHFGEGNYFLGHYEPEPDLSFPSAPVFAVGTLDNGSEQLDIIIHEETEDKIEIWFGRDINDITQNDFIVKSYSYWIPGMNSPFTNSKVREISIRQNDFILAVVPEEKKIWLYESSSGVNHLIPVSNYYNSLMLYRNERNAEKVLNPNLFFNNLGLYNDLELKSALEIYNKYMRRKLL